jgi:hypothetical protein
MKLLRYGPNGHEMPGILDDNISEELLPLSLDRFILNRLYTRESCQFQKY